MQPPSHEERSPKRIQMRQLTPIESLHISLVRDLDGYSQNVGQASRLRATFPGGARTRTIDYDWCMKKHVDYNEIGPDSAGQSGDNQGLPNEPEAGPESVDELVEEGQFFEAGVIEGVEDAPDEDVKEVRTRQLRMDDVPGEYLDRD